MAITPLPTPAPSRSQSEVDFVASSNALFGALPTLVTQVNDAIDEINQIFDDIDSEVVGVWTQIGADVPATSGGTITFANIPQTYRDLRFEFVGVSGGGSYQLQAAFSADGSSYTTASNGALINAAAADTLFGDVIVLDYKASVFAARSTLATLGAPPACASSLGSGATAAQLPVRLSGPLTHVRFSVTVGNFDAGLIRLKGR